MKNLLILILISLPYTLFSQKDTIIVPKIYGVSPGNPIVAGQNDIIICKADSIYIINKGRFQFYEQIRSLLNYDIGCNDVINAYQNSIEKHSELLTELISNYEKEKAIDNKMILEMNSTINFLASGLKENGNLLNESIDNITELENENKRLQRRKNLQIIITGISGTLLGILIKTL